MNEAAAKRFTNNFGNPGLEVISLENYRAYSRSLSHVVVSTMFDYAHFCN